MTTRRMGRESEHRRDLEPEISIANFVVRQIWRAREDLIFAKETRVQNWEGFITDWKVYRSDMPSILERLKMHGLVAQTGDLKKLKIDFKKSDIVALREFRDRQYAIARTLEGDVISELKNAVVRFGELYINKKTRKVIYRGRDVAYTRGNKSVALLEKLMRAKGIISFQEALKGRDKDVLSKLEATPKTTKKLVNETIKHFIDGLKVFLKPLKLPDGYITPNQTHKIIELNIQDIVLF